MYYEYELNDDIMLDVFKNEEFVVVKRVLTKIRKNLSIVKHNHYRTKKYDQSITKTLFFMNFTKQIDDFERKFMYIYFRQRKYVIFKYALFFVRC